MKKKSHWALANYIARQVDDPGINKHKFSFLWGSMQPDLKLSFFVRRHEYNGTIDFLKKRMEKAASHKGSHNLRYYRHLGEISHYMADYFTSPHNAKWQGKFHDHNVYEMELQNKIRRHLRNIREIQRKQPASMPKLEELFDFIQKRHDAYILEKPDVNMDIRRIVDMNHQVIASLVDMHNTNRQAFLDYKKMRRR